MNNVIEFSSVVFLQSVFIMQLFEYFVWSKTFSNRLLSQIALSIIILQPIISILRLPRSNIYRNYLIGSYILFFSILHLVFIPFNKIDFRTIPYKNGHLAWYWVPSNEIVFIWAIFSIIPSLLLGLYRSTIIASILFILTFLFYSDTKTWGSLWCWAANIIGFTLIFDVFWKDFCTIPNYPNIFKNLRSIFSSKISLDFVR